MTAPDREAARAAALAALKEAAEGDARVAILDGATWLIRGDWRGAEAVAAARRAREDGATLLAALAPAPPPDAALDTIARRAFEAWIRAAARELAPDARLNALRTGPAAPVADAVAALALFRAAPSITGQVVELG